MNCNNRNNRVHRTTTSTILTSLLLLLVASLPIGSLPSSASAQFDWSTPSPIKTDIKDGPAGPGEFFDFALNGAGSGVAVWLQGTQLRDATAYNVIAASFSIKSGWAASVVLDTTAAGPGGIDAAIDDHGNAIAVWEHSFGSQPEDKPVVIQARFFSSTTGWGVPSVISLGDEGAFTPQIGMDAGGNGTAVWIQYNESMYGSIWSTRYVPGLGWAEPRRIDASGSPWVGAPVVAVDPGGNATAAWSQDADDMSGIWVDRCSNGEWGTPTYISAGWWPKIAADALGDAVVVSGVSSLSEGTSSIVASRFTPGTGWSSGVIETFSGFTSSVSSPNVEMNSAGDTIVTWIRSSGTYMSVVASRNVFGSGWGTPVAVGSPVESRSPGIDAAIDSAGNAIVVWERIDPSPSFVWAARYTVGLGWLSERSLDVGASSAGNLRIAVDAQGNAAVAWAQGLRSGSGLWWDTYSVSGGWGTTSLVEYASAGTSTPHITAYGEGNAVAIWSQGDEERSTIWTNFYREGIGWRQATPIVTTSNIAFNPAIGADPSGNAIAVWEQLDGFRSSVRSSHYRVGVGWGGSVMLDNGSTNAYDPQITMDKFGNAFVGWYQRNGSDYDICGDRYDTLAGWGTPGIIGSGTKDTLNIKADDLGNVLFVWVSGSTVWSDRYVLATGWTGPEEIGARTSDIGPDVKGIFGITMADVALDARGDAIVIWPMNWWNSSGGTGGLWANRFETSVGWSRPIEVPYVSGYPHIAIDAQGNALVLWQEYLGWHDFGHIFTLERQADSQWGTWASPTQVDDVANMTGNAQNYPVNWIKDPLVAMSSSGGAVAVWQEYHEPDLQVWASNFTPGMAWGTPVEISQGLHLGYGSELEMAMDPMGNAMVVWVESDGNISIIWSARYSVYNVPPDTSAVIPDIAFLRWLAIADTFGIIILASLVFVLYRTRRKWKNLGLHDSRDGVQLDANGGSPTQVMGAQAGANDTAQNRHWPTGAISGPLRVTAKERILLHLLHFARYADSSEVPPELTQERIAEAAGIDRRHFTQYVRPLEEDELVRERASRVRGIVQKRRVYVLTEEGVRRALGVRDRLRSATVSVRDDLGVREVTVAEALLEARGFMSVLDVLRESIETGIVDLTRSASSAGEPSPTAVLESPNGEEINLVREDERRLR